jgi:hypothetical protein
MLLLSAEFGLEGTLLHSLLSNEAKVLLNLDLAHLLADVLSFSCQSYCRYYKLKLNRDHHKSRLLLARPQTYSPLASPSQVLAAGI